MENIEIGNLTNKGIVQMIDNPLDFSIDIWKVNMNYYESKDTLLSHVNMKWAYKLGFTKNTTVYAFCKYYYEFLLNIKKHYN